jgi:glutaminase
MAISPSLVLCRTYSALEAPSRRVRSATAAARLHELAVGIKCLTLQGDVAFDGAEFVVRNLIRLTPEADSFILDMNRVSHLTDSAATLFHDVSSRLWREGKVLVYSRIRGKTAIEDALRRTLATDDGRFLSFEDNDVATEWCENRLLETETGETVLPLSIKALADFPCSPR